MEKQREFDAEMRKIERMTSIKAQKDAWTKLCITFPVLVAEYLTDDPDFVPYDADIPSLNRRIEHTQGGWNGVRVFRSSAEYRAWLGR